MGNDNAEETSPTVNHDIPSLAGPNSSPTSSKLCPYEADIIDIAGEYKLKNFYD